MNILHHILIVCVFLAVVSCDFRVERDASVLVDSFPADPATLNPILASEAGAFVVGKYIFESLIERDNETLELIPRLARKWEISPDHLSYTFWIRDGIKWQDGAPFTVDDVIYTFGRIMDPKADAALYRSYFKDVVRVEKVADDAMRVAYSRPYFKALDILGSIFIVPKHIYDDGRDFNSHPTNRSPVGTGPYRFAKWETGRLIRLERFEYYWGKMPDISGVLFKIIPDRTIAFELLKKGAVDLATVRAIQWTRELGDPEFEKKFTKHRYYLPNCNFIAWNLRTPFFDDRRVRIAMTMLINRDEILDKILFGEGEVVASNFYRFGPFYDDSIKPYPYDPAGAARLLDEAGWRDSDGDGIRDRNGIPFKFTLIHASGEKFSRSLGLILREELSKAGIGMEAREIEWAAMMGFIAKRNFDAVSVGWAGPPNQDVYSVWHSSEAGEGQNLAGLKNERADRLLDQARLEFDEKKRIVIYRELQKILHEEEPCTFLFTVPSLVAVAKRFEDVKDYRLGLDTFEWKVGPWPILYEW